MRQLKIELYEVGIVRQHRKYDVANLLPTQVEK